MKTLEEKINYTFKNKDLLKEALTHSSYANDCQLGYNNERMEFLGDAVLSLVSAQYLYERYPDWPEGDLSKLRSSLVCTQSLSDFAREIDLGNYLLLGRGELKTGGSDRSSNLENAFEALIAAIYLDGGMEPAKRHVMNFVLRELKHTDDEVFKDYKTALQELLQGQGLPSPEYQTLAEEGPAHLRIFTVAVYTQGQEAGRGSGNSKKRAEQAAAGEALKRLRAAEETK